MNFHIVTLFPEMFDSYLGESILARAIKEKKIKVNFVNPRKFVSGKYKKVWPDGNVSLQIDERPYGGGPGMVMMAEPIVKAVDSIVRKVENRKSKIQAKILVINFVPSGEKFTTDFAQKTTKKYTDVIMICGRYEGVDARVDQILKSLKISIIKLSIGDYVLTGGELPAMILMDCMSRQVPGVLGNFDSREEARVSSSEVYTRPEIIEMKIGKSKIIKKYKVPSVLLSGNHKDIENWKNNKRKTD
jgi:tRNA (guanine37-N1)-methyltransferase